MEPVPIIQLDESRSQHSRQRKPRRVSSWFWVLVVLSPVLIFALSWHRPPTVRFTTHMSPRYYAERFAPLLEDTGTRIYWRDASIPYRKDDDENVVYEMSVAAHRALLMRLAMNEDLPDLLRHFRYEERSDALEIRSFFRRYNERGYSAKELRSRLLR